MKLSTKKLIRNIAIIVGLIIVAVVCRCSLWQESRFYNHLTSMIRTLIYLGLFTAWGFSLHRRIIQKQVSVILVTVAGLLVFWNLMRTIKWYALLDTVFTRYCWYAFYIGIIMIPTLSLLAAICVGKEEHYKLPKWAYALLGIGIFLVLLVFTNDLHQLVFTFPEGKPFSDSDYGYNKGFFIVEAWELGTSLATMVLIIAKCRNPFTKKIQWFPFIPFILLAIYAVVYVTDLEAIKHLIRDMTAINCLSIFFIWESCLQCELIQTNTQYDCLLSISNIPICITDNDSTDSIKAKVRKDLVNATEKPIILEKGIRLSEAKIKGGHVFWEEDISALLDTIENLSGVREELQSYSVLIQEKNREAEKLKRLEQQKNLYCLVEKTVNRQMSIIAEINDRLQNTYDLKEATKLLIKIIIIGTYVKRRSNLVFLSNKSDVVPSSELLLCLDELATNLRLLSVNCAYNIDFEGDMGVMAAGEMLDFYQAAVELSLDTLLGLTASFTQINHDYKITLMVDCKNSLMPLKEKFSNTLIGCQDNVWFCSFVTSRGGELK